MNKDWIKKHLTEYGKAKKIDEPLIDRLLFIDEELTKLTENIKEHGTTQTTKNGFITKSGYQAALEGYLRYYIILSNELGMSPKARDKWQQPKKEKPKNPLIK